MVVKNMFAFEESDDLAFDEIFEADGTVFVGVSNFHFFDIVDFEAHSVELFFEVVLFKLELEGIFEHELMESFWRHAKNRRLFGCIFVVILTLYYRLILILVVDEVKIVLACGVGFDWTVLAHCS